MATKLLYKSGNNNSPEAGIGSIVVAVVFVVVVLGMLIFLGNILLGALHG